jgi:hypothetical protein
MVIQRAARGNPLSFCREVLKEFIRVVKGTAKERNGRRYDSFWSMRTYAMLHFERWAILYFLAEALAELAKKQPDELDCLSGPYLADSYDTIDFLILNAWTANPTRYANRIVTFLCADRQRLTVEEIKLNLDTANGGERVDLIGGVLPAIREASTHCDGDHLSRLENQIFRFRPSWEKRPQEWGEWELTLSLCVARSRRSHKLNARIEELYRKFPQFDSSSSAPTVRGGTVGSPIDHHEAEKMSDSAWLSAMNRYDKVGSWGINAGKNRDGTLKGGCRQLGRQLEWFCARNARRFLGLMRTMDSSLSHEYFAGLITGAAEYAKSNAGLKDDVAIQSLAFDAIRCVHALPEMPCATEVCRLVRELDVKRWPEDIVEVLIQCATMHKNPPADKARSFDDLYNDGINTARGTAADTIATLMFKCPELTSKVLPAIEIALTDSSLSVRSCAVRALLPLLNTDRERAIELFVRHCSGVVELLASYPAGQFLHYTYHRNYAQIRPILQQMLASGNDAAVHLASIKTCLAGLEQEGASADAAQIHVGTDIQKAAAVEVYASNLRDSTVGEKCTAFLRDFVNDPSEMVHKHVEACFNGMDGKTLRRFESFISVFIQSKAFESHSFQLVYALQESRDLLPKVVLELAERATGVFGQDAASPASRRYTEADSVSKLVFRVYQQYRDDNSIQERCLDIIDSMEAQNFFGSSEQLKLVER